MTIVSERHILVACHAWYGDMIGGAFRLATDFARDLAASGQQVSYVCCATSPEAPRHEQQDGVRIYRYSPPPPEMAGVQKLMYHVRQTRAVVRSIHHVNRVHALSSHSPLQGLGAAIALNRQAVFKNYTVHSPFDDELLSNLGPGGPTLLQRLVGRAARWVDRRNIVLADRVQTVSRYTLQNLQQKYGRCVTEKGVVAPGWVEADRFRPVPDRRALRSQLGEAWDTDKPLFFTLRRLEARMGLDTLIEACQRLARDGVPFRTLIGGDGSQKKALQQMIDRAGLESNVRLLGRLPEDRLAAAYASADCFVLPTRALECFGLIVLEAFACDTPVIASSVAAIPELAERQGREWMFEPGHVDELSQRLSDFAAGALRPTIDLRATALEFDKPKVLQSWQRLIMDEAAVSSCAAGF
ncbi:MAG: glycosyltransferase [Fuerstiella sp.]